MICLVFRFEADLHPPPLPISDFLVNMCFDSKPIDWVILKKLFLTSNCKDCKQLRSRLQSLLNYISHFWQVQDTYGESTSHQFLAVIRRSIYLLPPPPSIGIVRPFQK